MKLPENIIKGYEDIDARYRISKRVGVGIVAEVTDNTTGKIYAKATGSTETEAVANALDAARSSAKPLTKAQQSDPVYSEAKSLKAQLEAANAEIERLRAESKPPGRKKVSKKAATPAQPPQPQTSPTDSD